MTTKILNCTPHDVNVITHNERGEEVVTTFKPTGIVPRLKENSWHTCELNGLPIYSVSYEEPENLPFNDGETVLIVSGMILDACPDREDLVSPFDIVRDESGRIVGCRGFRK